MTTTNSGARARAKRRWRHTLITALLGAVTAILLVSCAGPPDPGAQRPPAAGPAAAPPVGVVDCVDGPPRAAQRPVLLVPPTTLTAHETFSWNHLPWLAQSRPVCTVDLPARSTGDMQVSSDHVARAVSAMAHRFGGPVEVVGFSQGGVLARAALRFWPDTRPLVDDLVMLGAPNHGSSLNSCQPQPGCAPALWQLVPGSRFLTSLNTPQETFDEVDTTSVFSTVDDTVQPQNDLGSSALRGRAVRNVAVQQVCPDDRATHLELGTVDGVAAALVVDALDHDGPADPGRVGTGRCRLPLTPGVAAPDARDRIAVLTRIVNDTLLTTPKVAEEPITVPPVG